MKKLTDEMLANDLKEVVSKYINNMDKSEFLSSFTAMAFALIYSMCGEKQGERVIKAINEASLVELRKLPDWKP